MRIEVVTLFPEFVTAAARVGIVGRAVERSLVEIMASSPREYATDAHRTVDDRPYGGGPGMVLKAEPTRQALRAASTRLPAGSLRVYMAADGVPLRQSRVREFARLPGLLLLAGRYEGVDERLIESDIDESVSIGDFVLSGGELPALALIDAVVRLLPGALGDEASADQDSFMDGLLDWPHYTRPEYLDGARVPAVLLGGNHAAIRRWRLKQALGRTWTRRPDLLMRHALTAEQRELLEDFLAEQPGEAGPRGPATETGRIER